MTTHHTDERTLPADLQARLDHLEGLERNWDSYDAEPISPKAISLAKTVVCRSIAALERHGAKNVYPFAIAPVSDGGVQLEWRGPAGFVEIEISPSGSLTALVGGGEPSSPAEEERPNVSVADIATLLVAIG